MKPDSTMYKHSQGKSHVSLHRREGVPVKQRAVGPSGKMTVKEGISIQKYPLGDLRQPAQVTFSKTNYQTAQVYFHKISDMSKTS